MNVCMAEVAQLFISVNVINVILSMILLYMIFLMRETEWQWVWFGLIGLLIVVSTFSSYMGTGCEMSGVAWRFEWMPTGVGLDWQTYYLLLKFIYQGIYDWMVFVR